MKTSINIRGVRSQAKHATRAASKSGHGHSRGRGHQPSKHGLNLHNTPDSIATERFMLIIFIGCAIAVILFH